MSVTAEIFLICTNVTITNVAWTNIAWTNVTVLDVPRNLPVKFHQYRVSNSWDIPDMDKCHEDKCYMTNGQMSPWQLEYVLKIHRNLPLKFHQNRVRNSWVIADIEFVWWWGLQPCVEVRLGFWQFSASLLQNTVINQRWNPLFKC